MAEAGNGLQCRRQQEQNLRILLQAMTKKGSFSQIFVFDRFIFVFDLRRNYNFRRIFRFPPHTGISGRDKTVSLHNHPFPLQPHSDRESEKIKPS